MRTAQEQQLHYELRSLYSTGPLLFHVCVTDLVLGCIHGVLWVIAYCLYCNESDDCAYLIIMPLDSENGGIDEEAECQMMDRRTSGFADHHSPRGQCAAVCDLHEVSA